MLPLVWVAFTSSAIAEVQASITEIATSPAAIASPTVATTPVATVAAPEVNLLAPAQGGQVIVQPKAGWDKLIDGRDHSFVWAMLGQEVVFAFKDEKAATFDRFELEIPFIQKQNVKDFELSVSDDSPNGPFRSLGQFTARNYVGDTPYQKFHLNKTTAKYLKFRTITNYGYEPQGWGNVQLFQMRLLAFH